ncbi:odorant receptor 13a-like [Cataglyphis hispanica]|uniref:odorant receptor 13a-like n=1 Tax=Cataglyphis hispanica TaxID=1086592 RepID=UPI00217F32CE|nr:odorant receptor 13a-like [Cataglyphis hispanica]
MTRKNTINSIIMLILPLYGIWPGRPITLINRVLWMIATGFVKFCHCLYILAHFNSQNFFNLIDCLCSILSHAKLVIKLLAFWINQRKFIEILASITDDWNDCADNDISMRLTMRKAKLSDRITYGIITLYTMTIFGYCLGVIIADADVTDQTIEVPFLNKVKFPFSIHTQNMYRFVLIVEFVHMLFSHLLIGIVNNILLTLVLHVGGQVEILQSWLSQLIPKKLENKEESLITATNKIIRKHNKIIQFSENIETLYAYIALYLFVSDIILICSIAFLIITALGTPNAVKTIMKCLLFFSDTNLEAFIFCYAGEYLSNKGETIGFAIYNCPWYNLRPKDIRVLLFIIIRSQKQLTLTAGKMMDLSLKSFTSIMNASGSFLSLLLAMQ